LTGVEGQTPKGSLGGELPIPGRRNVTVRTLEEIGMKRGVKKWLKAEQGSREVFKPWRILPLPRRFRVGAYGSKAAKLKNRK
jgi:hypothetical protein